MTLFRWQKELVHTSPNSTVRVSIEANATGITGNEGYEDRIKVEVGSGGDDLDGFEHEGEADVAEDGPVDTLPTFPFDLARKARLEMMVYRLYIALSDDDREVAALCTRQCEKFTHIIRITFDPPSVDNKVLPSNWSVALNFSDERLEMHIRCPAFIRGLGEYNKSLTKQQLLLASKFIAFSLPYRHDKWFQQGIKFPFSQEECHNSRVLIVGPSDRSVDVMAILVGYLSSLTGAHGQKLLASVRKFDLVHSHWKNCLRGNVVHTIIDQK